MRIVGDKAYPVRAPAYYDDVYSPAKVRNEVEYLSYYLKNRRAAEEHKKTLEPGKPAIDRWLSMVVQGHLHEVEKKTRASSICN